MTETERTATLAEVAREGETFFQKRLLKRGLMGRNDAVEVCFRIVPRLTIKAEEASAPSRVPIPAEITDAEWTTILQSAPEQDIPFRNYNDRDEKIATYMVPSIQRGLKKLRVNNNQPKAYGAILLDARTATEVNAFLAYLKLDLRLRTFGLKMIGKRLGKERRINHVVLVRDPSQAEQRS